MSAAMLEVINQLNPSEQDMVIDYAKNLIFERKNNTLNEGYKSFLSARRQALESKPEGMTLDEINDIIRKTREEKMKLKGNLA